jgi:hypothetical protein
MGLFSRFCVWALRAAEEALRWSSSTSRLVAGARRNGPKIAQKKQGRRRSIPSTTLPAPDIEIGSRHPVNFRMPGILTGKCEPVHKGGKKLRQGVP